METNDQRIVDSRATGGSRVHVDQVAGGGVPESDGLVVAGGGQHGPSLDRHRAHPGDRAGVAFQDGVFGAGAGGRPSGPVPRGVGGGDRVIQVIEDRGDAEPFDTFGGCGLHGAGGQAQHPRPGLPRGGGGLVGQ